MRELGLDMTSEMLPGIEEVQFRVNGQNEYQVLPHEMGHPHPMNPQDPSFPQPPLTGGQSFASTLLLSFSCTPLLKQQLLRTLSITSEDLASLEPIMADAFDQWDHQVCRSLSERIVLSMPRVSSGVCTLHNKPLRQRRQTVRWPGRPHPLSRT